MGDNKISVLIIDDEQLLTKSLAAIFEEKGYKVKTTAFGKQGIEWLEEGFNVVLLDLKLPDIDGLQVLKKIKRTYPGIVVIIITAFSSVNMAVNLMNEGAYSYVSKPFEVEELRELIDRGLKAKADENNKHRLLNNLSLLYQVNREMEGLVELQSIAGLTARYLIGITKIDICALLLFDEKTKEFFFGALSGVEYNLEQIAQKRFKLDKKMYQRLIDEQVAVLIPHLKTKPDILKYIPASNPKSLCIFPLVGREKVRGLALFVSGREVSIEEDVLETVKTITTQAAICIENANRYLKLKHDYLGAITALVGAVEDKDEFQQGHSEAVAELAVKVAKKMNLLSDQVEFIRLAGLLHDIGKISISENILLKKNKLTVDEFMKLKMHSIASTSILRKMDLNQQILPMVLYHHERYDGSGYPEGLRAYAIPLGARILAVCDAYNAMVSVRPYRKNLKQKDAIEELKRCSKSQFDPDIVDVFVNIVA
ncbi:MAG: response regulator [Candidatus Omnitrophica bacterium]|nr:response regulator [Candidatus Omnitrophota bacterium]